MKCNTCSTENVEGARFCASCGAVLASATPAGSGLVGQVIGGRFHVKRILGEGGMGVVYEAEQPMGSHTRKVALKTLHAHLSHDPSVSQRFNRECGTISQLEHPNTIKVYDFGATPDGTLYIAMEFVAGKSLNQLIQESGALDAPRVLRIMKQITGSLEEAHRQGVIHRDLKPDNVVLTERAGEKDVVKLLDFGIAARTESADAQREQKLTQQGMVLGTPPYMSPEQFTGKALDARSDVYSLGVMAYEMLAGRLPFDADTPWQWATEHMTSQPRPFEASVSTSIPAQMRGAILRSLAKNRDDRQASAKLFYDELAGEAQIPVTSAAGSSGTAAMAAPPTFGAGVSASAKTAAMPANTPAAAPQIAPIPPPAAQRSGGGKGLIIGLGAVGAVLLVGIVIVATRSMKPAQEETLTSPFTSATAVPAKVEPLVEPVEPPEPAVAPTAAAPETAPGSAGKATTGTVAKGGSAGTAAGSGGAATTAPTTPRPATTPTQPAPPAGDPCQACLGSAGSNIPAAAAAYGKCTDAGKKAQCAARVKGSAPGLARAAAFNNNCAQAKAIQSAAVSMGASAGQFGAVAAQCK